jgi:hypothetical protein
MYRSPGRLRWISASLDARHVRQPKIHRVTSGRNRRDCAIASAPFAAFATSSMSAWLRINVAIPSRMSGWSSTLMTRTTDDCAMVLNRDRRLLCLAFGQFASLMRRLHADFRRCARIPGKWYAKTLHRVMTPLSDEPILQTGTRGPKLEEEK